MNSTPPKPAKIIKVVRTGPDHAQLIIERNLSDPSYAEHSEYSYEPEKSTEKYVFFLSMEELYQITKEALRASSETIKIQKPGTK